MSEAPRESGDEGDQEVRTVLSRELGELLIELSIGVHRFAMYPPGHPSLEPVAEKILVRLSDVLQDRDSLTIGVAQNQLVIEGMATEQTHPVLSDLASELHEEQLGALTLRRGVTTPEIEDLLRTLSREGDRRDETPPLGSLPREELPTWEHVRVYPVGYDQLRLQEGEGVAEDEPERATLLWLGLAHAAMATEEPLSPRDSPDARRVAETIDGRQRDESYDKVIVGYFLQLAEELKTSTGAEASRIKDQVSTLIDDLTPETLERLVELGGDANRNRSFVLDANEALAGRAVIKLLQAAATVSEQTISNSLTRLLSKLSMHAEKGTGRIQKQADSALRDNVEELISDWMLEDPNPDQYTQVLDSMARSSPLFHRTDAAEGREDEEGPPGAERLVKMSLEIDAGGPTVESAVNELITSGRLTRLMELVESAPHGSAAAERIRGYVSEPSRLRQFLSGSDVDAGTLRTVVDQMGEAAAVPLLDALVESESRSVRRTVFEELARMQDVIGERVMERLRDPRWYVVRQMLALVQRLDRPPDGIDPMKFLRHDDHRVRREAFPLAMEVSESRTRALATALGDDDDRLVRMALLELKDEVPDVVVPTLVNRVVGGDHPPSIRAMAIRTLASAPTKLARECVVGVADGGRTLLGRRKVAERTPAVLAALEVLARVWSDDEEVQTLLDAARRSKDPRIRSAAEEPSAGEP